MQRITRRIIGLCLSAVLVAVVAPVAWAQAQEGFAPSGDVDIHYRIVGDGPPLLMINGGPGWSSDHMLSVAERMGQAYRVILYDQRGTGQSTLEVVDSTTVTMAKMVEDVEALRRHLGVERWIVMGHSFGGMMAMAYAAAHPEPVEAMVLSAPGGATLSLLTYYPASLGDRLLPYEQEAITFWSDPERLAAAPKKAAYEIARANLGAFLYDRSHLDEMLAAIDENTWTMQVGNLVWADLMRIGFDVRDPLRSFDRPVLVVQGRQDALGALHAYKIAQLFPNAEFDVIEECAHITWLDQPDQYYKIVFDFLNALPERG